ncbi:MAG: hypothetical protein U9O63_06955, partial [Actinomycetota bacterium]|nr:hypothetical protein [Actinomycetota bacterium]
MRSRTPLALAALLVVALVATIGFAAFSTGIVGSSTTTEAVTSDTLGTSLPISGRVASAVFAMSVTSERNAEVPGTNTPVTPGTVESPDDDTAGDEGATDESTDTTLDAAEDEAATDEAVEDEAADEPETSTTAAPAGDTTPPSLKITSPKDGATVSDRVVEIEGTTEPGAKVFIGPYDADVDPGGGWAIDVVLAAGPNGAVVTARDSAGNESQKRVVINYDAPTTTTTKATTTTQSKTTATTQAPSPTTTKAPTTTKPPSTSSSGYSPQWPADGGGQRNVENWRSTVAKYWPADRVDCVLGIIYRESRGDPRAHNRSSNAMGLMQHLLKYWPSRAKSAGFV